MSVTAERGQKPFCRFRVDSDEVLIFFLSISLVFFLNEGTQKVIVCVKIIGYQSYRIPEISNRLIKHPFGSIRDTEIVLSLSSVCDDADYRNDKKVSGYLLHARRVYPVDH